MIEIDTLLFEVLKQLWIHSFDDFSHAAEWFLNTWPGASVVIENLIQNFAQAPVAISLNAIKDLILDFIYFLWHLEGLEIDIYNFPEIDHNEGCYCVVDSLNIATGWMSHMPNVQYSS